MKNHIYFVIGLIIGSIGLANLSALADDRKEVVAVEKKQTILGHRIGPGNQEMLVYSR
jgi:hypothetical protein